MRLAFVVEYRGGRYLGWQRQRDGRTLQGEVEAALGYVADHPVTVVAAGRTDAGVHASAQVIHLDTVAERPQHAWLFGVNSRLPRDIAMRWCAPVDETFHARFSATARAYRYSIVNRRLRPALLHEVCAWERRPLDAEAMNRAAQVLVGEHDFSAFRAAGCQARSPVRRVTRIDVRREGDLVVLEITANAFLHNMVRIVTGALLRVGRGEAPAAWVAQVLAGRDRRGGGTTAPAQGLCLCAVHYPERFGVPASGGDTPAFLLL